MRQTDDFKDRVCRSIEASIAAKQRLLNSAEVVLTVAKVSEILVAAAGQGHKTLLFGNGGSAADAQHLATELAGRYLFDRPAIPAVALSTNTSAVTAIGNDYGFDQVFSRQLEGLGTRGDVLVAITTSGSSANVLRAVEAANRLGIVVIGLTGAKGGRFAAQCDFALITPSFSTPRIQEGHIAMGHALCELVERALFEPDGPTGRTGRVPPRAGRRTPAGVTPIRRRVPKPRAKRGGKRRR